MEEEIKQNNILIAKFMNLDESMPHDHQGIYLYHSSWKWLMPVIEKIKGLICGSEFIYRFRSALESIKIDLVYIAVVEFIKEHNLCQSKKS